MPTEEERKARENLKPLAATGARGIVTDEEFEALTDNSQYKERVRASKEIVDSRVTHYTPAFRVTFPDSRLMNLHRIPGEDPKTIQYNNDFHDMLLCPEGRMEYRKRNMQNLHAVEMEHFFPTSIEESLAYQRDHRTELQLGAEVAQMRVPDNEWQIDPTVEEYFRMNQAEYQKGLQFHRLPDFYTGGLATVVREGAGTTYYDKTTGAAADPNTLTMEEKFGLGKYTTDDMLFQKTGNFSGMTADESKEKRELATTFCRANRDIEQSRFVRQYVQDHNLGDMRYLKAIDSETGKRVPLDRAFGADGRADLESGKIRVEQMTPEEKRKLEEAFRNPCRLREPKETVVPDWEGMKRKCREMYKVLNKRDSIFMSSDSEFRKAKNALGEIADTKGSLSAKEIKEKLRGAMSHIMKYYQERKDYTNPKADTMYPNEKTKNRRAKAMREVYLGLSPILGKMAYRDMLAREKEMQQEREAAQKQQNTRSGVMKEPNYTKLAMDEAYKGMKKLQPLFSTEGAGPEKLQKIENDPKFKDGTYLSNLAAYSMLMREHDDPGLQGKEKPLESLVKEVGLPAFRKAVNEMDCVKSMKEQTKTPAALGTFIKQNGIDRTMREAVKDPGTIETLRANARSFRQAELQKANQKGMEHAVGQ